MPAESHEGRTVLRVTLGAKTVNCIALERAYCTLTRMAHPEACCSSISTTAALHHPLYLCWQHQGNAHHLHSDAVISSIARVSIKGTPPRLPLCTAIPKKAH